MRLVRPSSRARAALLLVATLLAACGGDKPAQRDSGPPAEELYAQADALMEQGQFEQAASLYDDVERLYPYSQAARRAMLRSAEANYRAQNYEEARLAAERFLNFYPSDPDAPRAQYLIAQSHYDQIVDVGRDQGETRDALDALRQTVQRYPGTDEARRAALRLDLALDHLAGKEMEVGRYYLKRGHYVAAINRFQRVVDDYPTTSHVPEALHRLVEANLALGVEPQAREAAAVLGHNFPGSDWYAASYDLLNDTEFAPPDQSGSIFARAYRQIIKGEWL